MNLKLRQTNYCFLTLLFLILFCIHINESYYNAYNKLKPRKHYKVPTTTPWRKPSFDQYLSSYYRKPKSDKFFNPYLLPHDLLGQETMDVSNSIWSGGVNQFDKEDNNWKAQNGNTDFEDNVNGLVDNWIYDDADYDNYDYPVDHYDYPRRNTRRYNSHQYPPNNQPSIHELSSSSSYSSHQDPSLVKANRRMDNIMFLEIPGEEAPQKTRTSALQRYQPNQEKFNYGERVFDDPRRQNTLSSTNLSDLDLKQYKNKPRNDHRRTHPTNFHEPHVTSDYVEGKQIISGIDVNPLTSNAFLGVFTDSEIDEMYKANEIFSDFKHKTSRMKNNFDKAILDIGDVTIGRENKQTLKKDVNQIVSGITDTINTIQDNSINSKIRYKLKETVLGSKKNNNNRAPNGKETGDRKKGNLKQNNKLPKLLQRIKNKAKGMGNYVLKKAKQMLVKSPSPSSLTSTIDETERQGLTFIGGLLSGITAPATSLFSVILLVVVEVVSMGIQASLQINQSNPTVAIPTTTTAGT